MMLLSYTFSLYGSQSNQTHSERTQYEPKIQQQPRLSWKSLFDNKNYHHLSAITEDCPDKLDHNLFY